jgi:cobalt transporter subunit CbtA
VLPRILTIGVLAGALAGLLTAALQAVLVQPLIEQAELLEVAAASAHHHEVGRGESHSHSNVEDPPEDRTRRRIATIVAVIATGIGYGLLTSGALALLLKRGPKDGVVLGALGFLTMQLAPSLGAPPQPPGSPHYDVLTRQLWWLLAAACTALGCGMAWRAAGPRRLAFAALAALVLALPHAVRRLLDGMGPLPDQAQLMDPFVLSSLASSAVLWLSLGGMAGALHARPARATTHASGADQSTHAKLL